MATPAYPAGLGLAGIGKSFDGITVLSDVQLDVGPGEVLAVIGENGAGKSTLSGIIAGLIRPSLGRMVWRGKPYAPASPKDALAAGIGLIHQEMRLLPELSIAENVFVGHLPMKGGRVDRRLMNARTSEQLERLGLEVPPTRRVRDLRLAAQQQVEIAKALTWNSRLLILDEPTAALGSEETERLFEQVRRLRGDGVSFIYVSHRLDEIAEIADRIVVLRDGRIVARHGNARVAVPTLVENMVGRELDRMFPERCDPQGRVVLEVRDLEAANGSFADISFNVQAGEIFGIAGIVGSGRTELVRAISGADPLRCGTVWLDGRPLAIQRPRDAIAAGIVLVPEDRKAQGLVLTSSLAENLAIGNLDLAAPGNWVGPGMVRAFAAQLIARMGIRGTLSQAARQLSGGNQQKAVIAKWLARSPKVFILDEPTRGIDVGARAMIYDVIVDLARAGMAVILVSSDLDEVLGLSHRVMVLSRGRARGTLAHGQANRHSIMELATT